MSEKLCCYSRLRTPYNNTYTFGVDKEVKNFKNCGKIYYQVLPPMGCGPSHDVICRRNYYDEDCVECQKPIVDNNEKVELSKENFMIYRY